MSNVSFGLAPEARAVLNSVFLHHCVEAGLDMAIVNPAHVSRTPRFPTEERALADDLVFNRRPDALQRFIEHFDDARAKRDGGAADETEDPTAGDDARADGPLDGRCTGRRTASRPRSMPPACASIPCAC